MSQTEKLSIVVSETGSAQVAKMLRDIITEARNAGAALKTLRAQINGKGGGSKGSVKEAKKSSKSEAGKAAKSVADEEIAQHKRSTESRKKNELKVLAAKRKSDLAALESSMRASAADLKNTHSAAMSKIAAINKTSAAAEATNNRIFASDTKRMAKESKLEESAAEAKKVLQQQVVASKLASDNQLIISSSRTSTDELKNIQKAAKVRLAAINTRTSAEAIAEAKIRSDQDKALAKTRSVAEARRKIMAKEVDAARKVAKAKVALNKKVSEDAIAATRAMAAGRRKAMSDEIDAARRAAKAKIKAIETVRTKADRAIKSLLAEEVRAANKQKTLAKQVANAKVRESAKAVTAARRETLVQRKLTESIKQQTRGLRGLGNQVFFAQRAFAALGGTLAFGQYLKMSDTFQNMNNRIRLVTKGSKQFGVVQSRLQKIARDTRQSLSATTETYVRFRKATLSSGVSQERLFGVMTTLNQMLAVSGATATETEQSMRQLSQAFSKGKLDGDEFRSIGEAMPDILTILQESLGVTEGELRDMSEQGKITAKVMIEAFEGNADKAARTFNDSVATIGQAWQVLKDAVLNAVGAFNESSGAIGILVDLTLLLADNLWVVGLALEALVIYSFVRITKGALSFGRTLFTKTIPAIWSYITALKAANTAQRASAGSALLTTAQSGPLSAAQSAAGGRISGIGKALTTPVSQLGTTLGLVGSIGAAAAVAGAGFAGWNLGKALDNMIGISDALATIFSGTDGKDFSDTDALNKQMALVKELQKELAENKDGERKGGEARSYTRFNSSVKEARAAIDAELELAKIRVGMAKSVLFQKKLTAEKLQLDKDIVARQKESVEIVSRITQELDKQGTKKIAAIGQFLELAQAAWLAGSNMEDLAETFDRIAQNSRSDSDIQLEKSNETKRLLRLEAGETRELATIQSAVVQTFRDRTGLSEKALFANKELRTELQKQLAAETDIFFIKKKNAEEEAVGKGPKAKGGGGSKSTTQSDLDNLRKSFDPVLAAQKKMIEGEKILTAALRLHERTNGRLGASNEEYGILFNKLHEQNRAALRPIEALEKANKKLREEFGKTPEELAAAKRMAAATEIAMNSLGFAFQSSEEKAETLATALRLVSDREFQIKDNADQTARQNAIKSVTDSITSRTQALEKYQVVLQGIAAHTSLEPDEKRTEILKAQMLLYPAAAKGLKAFGDGTLNMTELQRQEHVNQTALTKEIEGYKIVLDGTAQSMTNYTILVARAKLNAAQLRWEIEQSLSPLREIRKLLSDKELNNLFTQSVTTAFLAFEEIVVNGVVAIQNSFGDLISGSGEGWKDFTDTLRESFSSLVDDMLADLTRLLIRMAMVSAIEGIWGKGALGGPAAAPPLVTSVVNAFRGNADGTPGTFPPIPGLRHGGTLPKFANGGGFQVGGTGGPDTKLIQFMASPGENVHVTNPGQSRLDNRNNAQNQPTQEPTIVVNNIMDPDQAVAAMSSPQGVRVIKNVMLDNAPQLRRFLNQG